MKLKEKINNNEKYKKYKEYKESFKTLLKDEKIGSIIKLSFWFIFILIIALFVRLNNKTENLKSESKPMQQIEKIITPTNEIVKQQLKNITNYEENITVETDIIENIKLTHANDEDLIIYNNEQYYNKDNLYLLQTNEIIENQLLKDIIYFNINNIKNRIENIEEDYITVYKDNSYIISYTIPTNEIPSFELLEEIEPTNIINITISGKEKINKIEITLENYNIKKITLELENINNIDNINVNMEVN